jgi:hypothetical protein
MTIATSRERTTSPQDPRLWFAVGVGPLAWGLHLAAVYFAASVFCGAGSGTVKGVIAAATVALAIPVAGGLMLGRRSRNNARAGDSPAVGAVETWLASAAFYLGALFLLAIVVQSIPLVMLDVCE